MNTSCCSDCNDDEVVWINIECDIINAVGVLSDPIAEALFLIIEPDGDPHAGQEVGDENDKIEWGKEVDKHGDLILNVKNFLKLIQVSKNLENAQNYYNVHKRRVKPLKQQRRGTHNLKKKILWKVPGCNQPSIHHVFSVHHYRHIKLEQHVQDYHQAREKLEHIEQHFWFVVKSDFVRNKKNVQN